MNTRTVARKVDVVTTSTGRRYAVVEVPSDSNPNKIYRVDVTNGRCSCPGWIHHRNCKHLRRFGYSAN